MVQKVDGVEFDVTVDGQGAIDTNKKIVGSNVDVEQSFNDIDAASKKAGDGVKSSTEKASKGVKGMQGNLGMAGVQFSQFTQQVAGGQNALLAFAQQSQDLAFFFGPKGALALSLGSIITLVGVELVDAFKKAGEEGEKLPEKLQKRLDEILTKYKEVDDASKNTFTQVEIGKLNAEYDQLQARIDKATQLIQDQAKQGTLTDGVINNYNRTVRTLSEEQEELAKLISKVNAALFGQQELTGLDPEQANKERASFEQRLQIAQDYSQRKNEILNGYAQRQFEVEQGLISQQTANSLNYEQVRLQNLKAQSEARIALLRSERDRVLDSETLSAEDKKRISDEYRNLELDETTRFEIKKTKIEKQGADARVKIAQTEGEQKLTHISSIFSNLSQLMNTESRKLFEVGKAGAVAGAIVDGYAAVSKTMASVPYPLNIPLAAAQAAASAAQVSGILSTKFGDKSAGQAFTGGQVGNVSAQPVGPTSPDRIVSVQGIDPNQLFTGRQIVDLINEAQADGARIQLGG